SEASRASAGCAARWTDGSPCRSSTGSTPGRKQSMDASQRGEETEKKGGGARRAAAPASSPPPSLDFVADVPLELTVEVGSARLRVRDVLALEKGSIVELDRASGEPADVLVNGRLVARGELSVVDDRLAVTVTEVIGAARRGER